MSKARDVVSQGNGSHAFGLRDFRWVIKSGVLQR